MWDEIFTMDMLTDSSRVAVNCPTEELEREFATLLDEYGIRYPNGDSPLKENYWKRYLENFCYYVEGKVIRYGPKSSTEESPWNRYEKYTFQDEPQDDTEIDDSDFYSIITSILGKKMRQG